MTKEENLMTDAPRYLSRHLVEDKHKNTIKEICIIEYSISSRYMKVGFPTTFDTTWYSLSGFKDRFDIVEDLPFI